MMGWIKVSHFSRGFLGAFAIVAGAATVLDKYAALDLAALVHATFVAWTTITGSIATVIQRVFNLPEFPPDLVSSAMLAAAIGPAWSYTIFRSEKGRHKGAVQRTAFGVRIAVAMVETVFWSLFIIAAPLGSMIFWIALVPLTLSFGAALGSLRPYRQGFMLAVGFLVFMEGLYLVSTDAAQDAFDTFVCEHAKADAPRCQDDER